MNPRTARLKELFKEVELPEIQGIDFGAMSHQEIAALLPAYGGKHPMKGILIDKQSGKAYGLASGWVAESMVYKGISFQSGAISAEVAAQAGANWQELGFH